MSNKNMMRVALTGNPNCGKTVIFNALTGSRQRVGNWPGVTVEKKTGHLLWQSNDIAIVDLPGIYSLSVISEEGSLDERVAYSHLRSNEVDLIVNVLDASNLERNLYLTLQLIEMRIPMILAVNMLDVLKNRGIQLNLKKLSELLNCPVVGLIASQNQGITELKNEIVRGAINKKVSAVRLPLPEIIQQAVEKITDNYLCSGSDSAFALRLLEGDVSAKNQMGNESQDLVKTQIQQIENSLGEEPDILIADSRYSFANQITNQVLSLKNTSRQTVTQMIDRIVLNRIL